MGVWYRREKAGRNQLMRPLGGTGIKTLLSSKILMDFIRLFSKSMLVRNENIAKRTVQYPWSLITFNYKLKSDSNLCHLLICRFVKLWWCPGLLLAMLGMRERERGREKRVGERREKIVFERERRVKSR